MPNLRHVLMTLHAISPRLAMRTLVNIGVTPPADLADRLRPHPGGRPLRQESTDALLAFRRGTDAGDPLSRVLDHGIRHRCIRHGAYKLLGGCLGLGPPKEQRIDDVPDLA